VGGRWRSAASHNANGSAAIVQDALHANLYNSTVLNLSSLDRATETYKTDPLPDEYFEKLHRRAERQEKQLRNIEKERAQHEKHHLERLLEGLKGHDWLKVMGISGITDSEKKDYEPKRAIFIKECADLLDRFRVWKEEEKRLKAEKDAALLQQAEDNFEILEEEDQASNVSDEDPPDYSDVDASAARQLHLEAIRATSLPNPSRKVLPQKKNLANSTTPNQGEIYGNLSLEKPFTSFYSKPYLRAAALASHRRSTRGMTAFGHPVPDLFEADFELPEDWTQGKVLTESQRRRRRLKRDGG
jgi:hypothetical protein